MSNPARLPVRAARGYIKGKRYDKAGRVVNAQLMPVSGLGGAISGKEMEKMMTEVADTHGLSANDIVIETYAAGTAPVQSNPAIGDKFERFTRTVNPDGWDDKYNRAFSGKGKAPEAEAEWVAARPGKVRLVSRKKD